MTGKGLSVVGIMLIYLCLSIATERAAVGQTDEKWYVGKGAEKDTFLRYNVTDSKVANSTTYELVVYFREKTDDAWSVDMIVLTGKEVYNSTLTLDDVALNPYKNNPSIPPEMVPYVDSYSGTIQWLGSEYYAVNPGYSLSADQWLPANALGGIPIKLSPRENLTISAGMFETTPLIYDSELATARFWIHAAFPFPIKGEYVSEESSYKYELVQYGNGYPNNIPEFHSALIAIILIAITAVILIGKVSGKQLRFN